MSQFSGFVLFVFIGVFLLTVPTCLLAAEGETIFDSSSENLGSDKLTELIDLQLHPVPVTIPTGISTTLPDHPSLNVPQGFAVSVYAADLSNPRFMAFSPDGVLFLANMGNGEIIALPDKDGDGVADRHIVALTGLKQAHSLAFYDGYLFVAEKHQVIRAWDKDGDHVYEGHEVFIKNIPSEGQHSTHTILFDEVGERIFLSVGSPCDLCRMEEGLQVDGYTGLTLPFNAERGTILQFNTDGSGRRIFANGIRNVIGMDIHPVTNELWANNNGHDLEGRTQPKEWIDIIHDGDFMGYPFVQGYQVWNDFNIVEYQPVLPISDADRQLVQRQKKPVALMPAHYAPMGLHFYVGAQFPPIYKNAAFVAIHAGREKLSSHPGYQVMALFSDPDGSNARMATFISGFQAGEATRNVWGFPVGLVSDHEGSLYLSSDQRNEIILKVTYNPPGGSGKQ